MICNILFKPIDYDFDFGASAEFNIQKKNCVVDVMTLV